MMHTFDRLIRTGTAEKRISELEDMPMKILKLKCNEMEKKRGGGSPEYPTTKGQFQKV